MWCCRSTGEKYLFSRIIKLNCRSCFLPVKAILKISPTVYLVIFILGRKQSTKEKKYTQFTPTILHLPEWEFSEDFSVMLHDWAATEFLSWGTKSLPWWTGTNKQSESVLIGNKSCSLQLKLIIIHKLWFSFPEHTFYKCFSSSSSQFIFSPKKRVIKKAAISMQFTLLSKNSE